MEPGSDSVRSSIRRDIRIPLAFALAIAGCSGGSTPHPDADVSATDATDTPDAPGDATPTTPIAMWQLPRNGPNSFALPWPSDLAMHDDGTIDLHFVPNAANNAFVANYENSLDHRIAGFSTVAPAYFRFTVPIDPTSLPPDVATTMMTSSSIQLIDVEHTARMPAQWYFREHATRYWPANTLAIAPASGFPLRPHAQYVIVVTRAVHSTAGSFQRDADLDAVLAAAGGDASVDAARTLHAPAVAALESMGIARDQILSLAVFTTQDPAAELFRAIDSVATLAPAAIVDITRSSSPSTGFVRYDGHYGPNPIFESGAQPYDMPGTADFVVDSSGTPQVQDTQNFAFTLTTPVGDPPATGWPIVIYAHGTGGNSATFVDDGTSQSLSAQGLAVFGFDQIFNGERAVGGPMNAGVQYFNFTNPFAFRNNNRQAAIDLAQASRFVRGLHIDAGVSATGAEVGFDAAHVMFFGHSQGSVTGPLWLAAENGAGAAVISATSGTLALSILQRVQPVNLPSLVGLLLGLSTSAVADELVPFHPALALAQTVFDACDPVNYARYIVREPRAGNPPRHVFLTEGIVDHIAGTQGIESVAMAMGLPLLEPIIQPIATYPLNGVASMAPPVSMNVAGGMATAGWEQFDMAAGQDGHYVIFDIAAARDRASGFLASYARSTTGGATLP
jgi:predicted esterase